MDKNKKLQKGFTFLELLIVIAIMVLFSTLSVGGYTAFNENKKIDSDTNQLVSAIELAKKKSRAGDKAGLVIDSVDYSACDLDGYKVTISSAITYSLQATMCANSSGLCPISSGCSDINLTSYSMSSSVTLSPQTGSVTIKGAGVAISGLSSISITNAKNNKSKAITINGAGIVETN